MIRWFQIMGLALGLALWGPFAFGKIVLENKELPMAIEEYLGKSFEGQLLSQIYSRSPQLKSDSFLLGGASARVALAVAAHLKQPKKFPLPERIVTLLDPSQDLDIVADLDKQGTKDLRKALMAMDPLFIGEEPRWEVMTLRPSPQRGFLGNTDIRLQNSDSLSIGLLRLYNASDALQSVMDARNPKDLDGGDFLLSIQNQSIKYYNSAVHGGTSMAEAGANPKVVSAMKYFMNVLRFEAQYTSRDFTRAKGIVTQFSDWLAMDSDSEPWPQGLQEGSFQYVVGRMLMLIENRLVDGGPHEDLETIFTESGIHQFLENLKSHDLAWDLKPKLNEIDSLLSRRGLRCGLN